MTMIETSALGRRYGGTWALRDCTLAVPEGHLVALVGPNGAGKTTLLNIAVGLTAPTEGEVSVLGGLPVGSPPALDQIAFVAQDMPLYRHLSVADTLHLARNLNDRFDAEYARRRVDHLEIGQQHRVGKLSGGQRAQLALTLALARHPRLLVLDEPTAPLDPVARHDFMATVVTAMTDDGLSIILSSHVLAELERVADYLVLLVDGAVRVHGVVDVLLSQHLLVTGRADLAADPRWHVVESRRAGSQQILLVAVDETARPLPTGWDARPVGVEELALAYLRESSEFPMPAVVEAAG